MTPSKQPFIVYNLYPKLFGDMEHWISEFDRIQAMHFNWLYINPIHAPGFSGSDYAVKDHYAYHPMFTGGWPVSDDAYTEEELERARGKGNRMLKKVCKAAGQARMQVMMDLVINHTAIDSPLVTEHPEWFKHTEQGTIKNPGAYHGLEWVAWGDLAEIDNAASSDREQLWHYWLDMMLHYCRLGIRGFRCDAAYHVPNELWQFLIPRIKHDYPDAVFMAETLGCTPKQLINVVDAGFDYVMNSFKWWNLQDSWFLKDYATWVGTAPSVTFPENHDTERFAVECNGSAALATAKYALGAYFCAGIVTTSGFEYGFRRKLDVTETNPDWQESPSYDISEALGIINQTKMEMSILQEDQLISMYDFQTDGVYGFTKTARVGDEKIFVIANISDGYRHVCVPGMYERMGGTNLIDRSYGHRMELIPDHFEYGLQSGEVKLLYNPVTRNG